VRKTSLAAGLIILVLVVAIVGYAVYPYIVSTKIDQLHDGATVYVYGKVTSSRFAFANISLFQVSDNTGSVYVAWDGALPATGAQVLIHGEVESILGATYIKADSVTVWYF
jgi:cytochrome c-type biogenesis protein CcmE